MRRGKLLHRTLSVFRRNPSVSIGSIDTRIKNYFTINRKINTPCSFILDKHTVYVMFLTVTDPAKREELFNEYQKIKKDIRDETEQKRISSLDRLRQNIETFAPIILAQKESTDRLEKTLKPQSQASDNSRDRTLREEDGKAHFGRKPITLLPDEIRVDDKTFERTPGLWSLITLKDPAGYTSDDAEEYKEFLKQTDYLYTVKGKFKSISNATNIPKKQLQIEAQNEIKSQGGSGIILPSDKNELIQRLRLLCAEFAAGNTNTRDEIVSILDELRMRNIISENEYQEINEKLYSYYVH